MPRGSRLTLSVADAARRCERARESFRRGQVTEAVSLYHSAAEHPDTDVARFARLSLATIIPGDPASDHAAVAAARRAVVADLPRGLRPSRRTAPGRALRVGYLSAFFADRNWMKPVFGVINRHDRRRIAVHLFADRGLPSEASGYLDYDTDVIHDITGVSNARADAIMRNVGLDVLVDLNGYSATERLGLLALRPAPVLVGWFNHFATSGGLLDWIVGDETVIRDEEVAHWSERIASVPGSYLAFEVRYAVPDPAPPRSRTAAVTFGCLGSHYKLTDAVLAAWRDILSAAPAARLFVKNAAMDDAAIRSDLLQRLALDPTRVTLEGRAEHAAFLAAYAKVDVALDTFPYNGGTTTSEALYQGVPVLTFAGDRWASRTSASLLRAAGLSDWIEPDVAALQRRAVALAHEPGALPDRATLRQHVASSRVCDTAGLCRALEDFYVSVAG